MSLGKPVSGGGFSGGGHSSGGGYHSSGNGLFTGLVIGSLLSSRRNGGASGGNDNGYDAGKYKKVRNQTATLIVSGIFAALTVLFIVLAVVFRFDAVYGKVNGTYEDYRIRAGGYSNIYTYVVDGKEYTEESQVVWTDHDGLDRVLYYNKKYPNLIYEEEARSYGEIPDNNFIYIFFAVFAGIVTIAVYAIGIYKYELDTEYVAEKKKEEREKVPEGKRRCPYCGSLMDEKETKCPNCGAGIK